MKLSKIVIVFVSVISIVFCYQETTYFIEISCTVAVTMVRKEEISVIRKGISLLRRLALWIAFIRGHFQDAKEHPCLSCHFRSFVKHDPIVLHYRQIFHVFDFSILPEAMKGPTGNSLEVYAKVFLIMVEEGIKSSEELRRFLLKHPALVIFLGFKLKGISTNLPFGFDIQDTVPSARHLRRKLQEIHISSSFCMTPSIIFRSWNC